MQLKECLVTKKKFDRKSCFFFLEFFDISFCRPNSAFGSSGDQATGPGECVGYSGFERLSRAVWNMGR